MQTIINPDSLNAVEQYSKEEFGYKGSKLWKAPMPAENAKACLRCTGICS